MRISAEYRQAVSRENSGDREFRKVACKFGSMVEMEDVSHYAFCIMRLFPVQQILQVLYERVIVAICLCDPCGRQ
jgi:hypothetical protein